jgi:hypothetical protein
MLNIQLVQKNLRKISYALYLAFARLDCSSIFDMVVENRQHLEIRVVVAHSNKEM